jgi:nitrate reductase gamma subunit
MDLLAFARGPALIVALAVFVAGIAWRFFVIFRRPASVDFSAPRGGSPVGGALRAIATRMWPYRTFRERSFAATLNAYAYHVGLAIVFFGFAPHIAFVTRLTGAAWPAVPGWLFVIAVGLVFIGLITALVARRRSAVLRLLSSFDDYASWIVTMLPMITGMALLSLPLGATYPPAPLDPIPVAVHLMSVELLLVVLPFSKLSHAFLVFVSRGVTGARFARKGAAF